MCKLDKMLLAVSKLLAVHYMRTSIIYKGDVWTCTYLAASFCLPVIPIPTSKSSYRLRVHLSTLISMVSTHATNKNAHPGEPDMPHPRRTSSQVQNDKVITNYQKEMAEQTQNTRVQAVATLESKMAVNEANAAQTAAHQSITAMQLLFRPCVCTDC
jgi:hypothetical protein